MTGVQSDASLESDGSAPASASEAADAVIHQQERQGLLSPLPGMHLHTKRLLKIHFWTDVDPAIKLVLVYKQGFFFFIPQR